MKIGQLHYSRWYVDVSICWVVTVGRSYCQVTQENGQPPSKLTDQYGRVRESIEKKDKKNEARDKSIFYVSYEMLCS